MVSDVIIFHFCSVRLLSAQSQRVAYKLASQKYLGCTRDQQMPGPFIRPTHFLREKPCERGCLVRDISYLDLEQWVSEILFIQSPLNVIFMMEEMRSCMAGTSQRCKRKKEKLNAEMQVWSLFKYIVILRKRENLISVSLEMQCDFLFYLRSPHRKF